MHDPESLESCVQELSRRIEVARSDFRLMTGEWPQDIEACAREIGVWQYEIRTAERDKAMHLFALSG